MNVKNYIFSLLCIAALTLAGCEESAKRVVYPYSCPELSGFTVSINGQMETAGSLYFSLDIKDEETPLSTLEVSIVSGDETLYSESIRTKGMSASITEHEIYLPFEANQEDNKSCQLVLTAINVEGSEQTETYDFILNRPTLPDVLYLHYDDNVILMQKVDGTLYEYATEIGEYPETFTGKISTDEVLDASAFIWGYSEEDNLTEIISETGAGFSFNYQNWSVEQIIFNALTFQVQAVGSYQVFTVNGTELVATGSSFYASIYFEQGSQVEMAGFDDLQGAYNRDFFEYDASSDTYTFLRESGVWEVYYSLDYNYMWIARMDDVAPDAYWLVGHGFTAAPVWNEDYDDDGWETDDIFRMAYIVKVEENIYQTTIYLNNTHVWESFEIEIYSDREWSKDNGIELKEGSLSGDISGIIISESDGFTSADGFEGFIPGYYRLTFDISNGIDNATLNFERLSE